MGQLLGIAIEVKQLRDSIRLGEGRVNVDMTSAAPRGEVLVSQFAQ